MRARAMAAMVAAMILATLWLSACAAAIPPKPHPPHIWHARLLPALLPTGNLTPPVAPVPRVTARPGGVNPGGPMQHASSPAAPASP